MGTGLGNCAGEKEREGERKRVPIFGAIQVCYFMDKVFFLNQWIIPETFYPYPSNGRFENSSLASYFPF